MVKNYFLSQKGSLAIQFLFGWVLLMGFVAIFAALTLTLSVAEVVQYITYTSSRQFMLGHLDEDQQIAAATNKYNKLTTNTKLCSFFRHCNSNGMFTINESAEIGLNRNFNQGGQGSPYLFMGVWTVFKAELLDINIPLWGSTTEGSSKDEIFTSNIGSYLGREPSVMECESFNAVRLKWIHENHKRYYQVQPRISPADANPGYFDNGC